MRVTASQVLQEIYAAPDAVRNMLAVNRAELPALARRLRDLQPPAVVTIARGSSDHAATFFKYLCEIKLGIPVASLGPSLATLYHAPLRMEGLASLAISQSGASPDLVALQQAVGEAGGMTIAAVNARGSPLSKASEVSLDLGAGPELSVAATKSFIASATLGATLVANWAEDAELLAALERLPQVLTNAIACDWGAAVDALTDVASLYVVGRGPGLAMAGEAALKLKEMCGLHAEAYSAAELLHGPVALAGPDFPVLVLAGGISDRTPAALASRLAADGVPVYLAGGQAEGVAFLPVAASDHLFTDYIARIASFYVFAEALARRRGFDPDRPPKLKKVTRTF
ncbi:MAG: SIS domain-containing protein [Rhizobiales bacterium]|nr:SIS domain-containing protein [Hyphomicrobiales bacterium]